MGRSDPAKIGRNDPPVIGPKRPDLQGIGLKRPVSFRFIAFNWPCYHCTHGKPVTTALTESHIMFSRQKMSMIRQYNLFIIDSRKYLMETFIYFTLSPPKSTTVSNDSCSLVPRVFFLDFFFPTSIFDDRIVWSSFRTPFSKEQMLSRSVEIRYALKHG